MSPAFITEHKRTDLLFDTDLPLNNNKVLLDFFTKTNNLYIEENEEFYNSENTEIKEQKWNTYYEWLKVFELICWKLKISEPELLDIYLEKNKVNLKRVHAK